MREDDDRAIAVLDRVAAWRSRKRRVQRTVVRGAHGDERGIVLRGGAQKALRRQTHLDVERRGTHRVEQVFPEPGGTDATGDAPPASAAGWSSAGTGTGAAPALVPGTAGSVRRT
jgi:hypothetical protein